MPKPFVERFPTRVRSAVNVELNHFLQDKTHWTNIFLFCDQWPEESISGRLEMSISNARKMHAHLGAALDEADRRGLK